MLVQGRNAHEHQVRIHALDPKGFVESNITTYALHNVHPLYVRRVGAVLLEAVHIDIGWSSTFGLKSRRVQKGEPDGGVRHKRAARVGPGAFGSD